MLKYAWPFTFVKDFCFNFLTILFSSFPLTFFFPQIFTGRTGRRAAITVPPLFPPPPSEGCSLMGGGEGQGRKLEKRGFGNRLLVLLESVCFCRGLHEGKLPSRPVQGFCFKRTLHARKSLKEDLPEHLFWKQNDTVNHSRRAPPQTLSSLFTCGSD